MKTPMQDFIDSVGYMAQGLDADELYDYFMEKATQMLEKEKEAIKDAYDAGLFDGSMEDVDNRLYKDYYNETFNTNQENLPDSTNGYTYYPQENKTVFNTKEK